jgi:ABC-type nitrate/sulfonate/bicarbonate transport system permease component
MMQIAEDYVGADLVFAWIGLIVVVVAILGGIIKLVEYLIWRQRPRGQPLLDTV